MWRRMDNWEGGRINPHEKTCISPPSVEEEDIFSSVVSIARTLDMTPNPILGITQLNCAYKLLALDLCILSSGGAPIFLGSTIFFHYSDRETGFSGLMEPRLVYILSIMFGGQQPVCSSESPNPESRARVIKLKMKLWLLPKGASAQQPLFSCSSCFGLFDLVKNISMTAPILKSTFAFPLSSSLKSRIWCHNSYWSLFSKQEKYITVRPWTAAANNTVCSHIIT